MRLLSPEILRTELQAFSSCFRARDRAWPGCWFLLAIVLGMAASTSEAAEQPTPEQVQFFEKHVRPLLIEQCQKCHGEDKPKGGFRVDSRGHLLLGGESGPAIVPGKPDESPLMEAVRYETFEMPPSKKMSDEQIGILAKWIEMGAPWPGDDGKVALRHHGDAFSDDDRNWWAFQPVARPALPEIKEQAEWCRNEIDRFILASMLPNQLTPAPEAARGSLIRRLYFDLIGLPPTQEQIQAFIDSQDPLAYEKIVDTLLASPEYGERWARHWLDLVRYAESDGFRADFHRPQAWRYRDYVIKSLNDDKPYDRFVQEQIAGDELYPNDPDALTATGYLRHGIYEYNARDVRGQWDNILNELTDTTADVFMGMGFQCARCHDHKYDPILQKDYFQLRAFFEAVLPCDNVIAATAEQRAAFAEKEASYAAQTESLRKELDDFLKKYLERGTKSAVDRFPDDIQAMIRKAPADRLPLEEQLVQLAMRQADYEHERVDSIIKGEEKDKVLALRRQLATFDNIRPEDLPCPMTVKDVSATAPPTVIPKRKTEVTAEFPTILEAYRPKSTPQISVENSTGRRAALAMWLTQPENPMTTRVIVNRVWQYHFGRGLVLNSSDFGRLGDPPTHPKLLDWLTTRFVDNGWRFKDLHRLILTSATYRQSSSHPELVASQLIDPANRWYWRAETHRLDAEQIRDSIFAVTGQLLHDHGGPAVLPDRPRRSIYTRIMRNSRDPLMDVFDLPQFFSSTASRDTTTSPVQSLLLINSQTMLKYAGELARRVNAGQGASGDNVPRIEKLWWSVLGRPPSPQEILVAQEFLNAQVQRINGHDNSGPAPSISTGKVPYRDGQAVLIQPEVDEGRLAVNSDSRLELEDFTIEAFFQLRSVYDTGSVRTIASKWSGSPAKPGWSFGITGKGSRRKPQTLVVQLFGENLAGVHGEGIAFSDQTVELNKPYFAAAAVRLATSQKPGSVKFYLKDLSNDEEPLLTAEMPLTIASGVNNREPLSLGSRGAKDGRFHGLIDDIRLSRGALTQDKLLFSTEGISTSTVAYWQFDPNPGMLQDSVPEGLNIRAMKNDQQQVAPEAAAFVDLCHVLLNSNEFLYVD